MAQSISYFSVQQYMSYLQQQMTYVNSGSVHTDETASVKFSKQQRIHLEILFSRQLRRLP
ncbi:hypothetical protein [Leptolyngbya sp. FACHB-671]|uniref:hypothetical protein n=1 Tax=Leptolyngbya sp. FACHB-671 TaxID=2692812 RepID=UPI0016822B6B|nr:hypothetical protein [Leptolyngbya sp. FACHB-671]